MLRTYICTECGTAFEATHRRCPICGKVGSKIDGRVCSACDVTLQEGPRQRCPSCGSTDVEPASVAGRA